MWLVWFTNRSGSTLLLNELNKYTKIVALPEGDRLADYLLSKPGNLAKNNQALIDNLNRLFETDPKLTLWRIRITLTDVAGSKTYADLFFKILVKAAAGLKPDFEIAVFKDTYIGNYFAQIEKSLSTPNKISLILLVRDPRSVFCSQKQTIGSWRKPMSSNPISTSTEWTKRIQVFTTIPGSKKMLRYEDFVANPDAVLANLFMDFNFPPTVKENRFSDSYFQRIPKHLQPIHRRILFPPNTSRIDCWENELLPTEIFAVEFKCRYLLGELGYTANHYRPFEIFLSANGFNFLIWMLKDWLTRVKKNCRKRQLPPLK